MIIHAALMVGGNLEFQENENSSDESTIGVPVTILSLDILERYILSQSPVTVYRVPLARDMYLIAAWYVHDFLDKLHISFTDPNGRELWYNEPKLRSKGISTRALHIIPIGHLWYSVDGVYKFTFHFSNDDGRSSEKGSFGIVLNRSRRS